MWVAEIRPVNCFFKGQKSFTIRTALDKQVFHCCPVWYSISSELKLSSIITTNKNSEETIRLCSASERAANYY
jgi:hypothetical protein